MEIEQFDAVVIGSGQGGNPLAKAMARHGWTTALVERRFVGGVCTNDGCTPTKVMVASAKVASLASRGEEYGIACGPVTTEFRNMMARQQAMALSGRHHIEESLLETPGLTLIFGEASFAAKPVGEESSSAKQSGQAEHVMDVQLRDGGMRRLRSSRVFLDVGERPHVPELEGLRGTPFLDSTSILKLESLPEHLVILGGGYIAVEFAQMFRRFGAAVTIVERRAQLLSQEDEDVAACLTGILREDGIAVLLNAEARSVAHSPAEGFCLHLNKGETTPVVRGSHLLIATGRTPNTEALQLGNAGAYVDEKGYVRVNERLETSAPGMWAMGDVTGGPPFTHIAYDDFRVLRTNLLEGGSRVTTGRQVPYAIFTDPELGRVGLSERGAREQGLAIRVAAASMKTVARAREMAETRGMMKAIVERGTDKLLGAAILSVDGGDVVTQLEIAMMGGLPYTAIREGIFIHPVLAEGLHVLFRSFRDEPA